MLTKSDILNGLLQNISLGDEPVVMVHSSYKSLRGVAEGPDGLIDSLLDFVGKNGTLLIPTFNFTCWSNEHYYDVVETPSEMGVVTELARKRQGFARTPHPIYSFTVYGKHQEAYLNAPSPSIMGEESVFSLFHEHNGLILSIGLDYNHSFTFVHHVELSAKAKHRRIKEFGGLYLDQNRELSLRKYQMYVRSTKKMSTYVNPAMEILATEGIIKNFNMGSARIDYAFAKEYYPRCFELVNTDPKLFYK